MDNYTKLFGSILDSTIWQEPMPTRIVWITLLAMCDKNGEVTASVPGLARRSNVTLDECEQALKTFLLPDKYSRTRTHEGRRVDEIDGGWRLLNHAAYRAKLGKDERREYQRVKQAQYRARKDSADVQPFTTRRTQAETDAFTETLLGKTMTRDELVAALKAFHGDFDAEPSTFTQEQRSERVREKIAQEEQIAEEVRAKFNPQHADGEPTEPPGLAFHDPIIDPPGPEDSGTMPGTTDEKVKAVENQTLEDI